MGIRTGGKIMNELDRLAPEYKEYTFKVITTDYERYIIKIVATNGNNAFTELFNYFKRHKFPPTPVTKLLDAEPYIIS